MATPAPMPARRTSPLARRSTRGWLRRRRTAPPIVRCRAMQSYEEARYPGTGSANGQVGVLSDGVATQARAGEQQALAAEAYAQASAAVATDRCAPPPGLAPGGSPPLPTPPVPTVSGVPTPPPPPPPSPGCNNIPSVGATPTPGSGGSAATPTPTPTTVPGSPPTPTATPCILVLLCPTPPAVASKQVARQAGDASYTPYMPHGTAAGVPPIALPDAVEQQLAALLKTADLANPNLLKLAGGGLPSPNPALPYAQADSSSVAVAQADNSGAQVAITVHLSNVELFQGLITFGAVNTTLKGFAPGSNASGKGTITTTIANAAIGGVPETIDQNGVQVMGQGGQQSASALQQLTTALDGALRSANVQITLTPITTMQDVAKWQGSGGGLEVT